MASGKLEWVFALLDKTSGPASTIEKKLELVEKRLKAIDKVSAETSDPRVKDKLAFARMGYDIQRDQLRMAQANEAAGSWVMKLHAGLAVLKMAGEAAGWLVDKTLQIGMAAGRTAYSFTAMAVEAASYKESNLIALKTLMGSEEAANRMMKWAVDFAAVTPFETKDVMGWTKALVTGGFKEREIPVILKAVGDMGSLHDFDKQIMDRGMQAFTKIRAKGKVQGEEMMQLAEAGIPVGKVYERLGKVFGVTSQEAQKMITAGQVGADSGLFAILDVLRTTMSGGNLGSLMGQYSTTITGLWSTLKSRPFEWMMDLDKASGFASLKNALANVLTVLDKHADRIKEAMAKAFNALTGGFFGGLGGDNGIQAAEDLLGKVLDAVEKIAAVGSAAFSGLGKGLLDAALGSDFLTETLTPEKLARIEESFSKLGRAIVDIVSAITRLGESWIIQDLITPSMTTGETLASSIGGAIPMFGGIVQGLAASSFADRVGASNQSVTINVDAPGATKEDADHIAKKIADRVPDLAHGLETHAAAMGAY